VGCCQNSTCDTVGKRQKLFVVGVVEAETLDSIHSRAGAKLWFRLRDQKLMGLWEQLVGQASCLTSD
jgi:hypothetical protein